MQPYIRAMEGFANETRLLPEQIWDQPDIRRSCCFTGEQTGSAMPLMWAHAEYIKLLRSVADGKVFDLIPEVAARYCTARRGAHRDLEAQSAAQNGARRAVCCGSRSLHPFILHWTRDEWQTVIDTPRR